MKHTFVSTLRSDILAFLPDYAAMPEMYAVVWGSKR